MSDQENIVSDELEESGAGGSPQSGPQRGGMRRRSYNMRLDKTNVELYKDVDFLRRFLTDRGKIRPRRQTGLAAREQRRLAQAVKRARHIALLPFVSDGSRND
ncbi:MAG: hypothetical protein OHK0023_01130 [Anaerolineae bacterium]